MTAIFNPRSELEDSGFGDLRSSIEYSEMSIFDLRSSISDRIDACVSLVTLAVRTHGFSQNDPPTRHPVAGTHNTTLVATRGLACANPFITAVMVSPMLM